MGFLDAAHFSKAFKQRFGASPRSYRQTAHGASVDNEAAQKH
ncbi:AraC family transcriptional regulator [Tsukamurella soli]